jgi:uncharacterized membrane protein
MSVVGISDLGLEMKLPKKKHTRKTQMQIKQKTRAVGSSANLLGDPYVTVRHKILMKKVERIYTARREDHRSQQQSTVFRNHGN